MKNYAYILGFISAIALIVLTSSGKMSEEELKFERYNKEELLLSSRINVINFVSNDELYESEADDDAMIIYPNEPTGVKDDANHFMVSEFTKYDKNATDSTKSKIVRLHIPQLERVRSTIMKPIVIRSAARSYAHEIQMGRSGKSQHVYKSGSGAVDISVNDYSTDTMNELENAAIDKTDYTRITRYPSFLHLDYAKNRYGKRGYYKNTKYGWLYIGEIK